MIAENCTAIFAVCASQAEVLCVARDNVHCSCDFPRWSRVDWKIGSQIWISTIICFSELARLKRTVFSIDLQEFLVPKRLCVCRRIRTCWVKQILWCSCNKVHWCTLSLRKSYTCKITCNCTSIKTMYTSKTEALGIANINWFGSCNYPRWARW
jgi:hypothetical protein